MKKGDIVMCIDNSKYYNYILTHGKDYEVIYVDSSYIDVVDNYGSIGTFSKDRFILNVSETRNNKLNKLLK